MSPQAWVPSRLVGNPAWLLSALCSTALVLVGPTALARVVLNEIHYEPEENIDPEEFIELHNPDLTEVNLSGWRFTDAIDYQFPAGTVLEGGGYLVVAEDPAFFQSRFGFLPLGPYSGSLSNEGERVELSDSGGGVEDEVDYRVAFPWPLDSAGQGSSMELVHPFLNNGLGASWRPSTGPPTPGDLNSVYAENPPPQIREVHHSPKQPLSGQPTLINAKVTDPDGIQSVILLYQFVSPGNYIPAEFPLGIAQLLANPEQPRAPNPLFHSDAYWNALPMRDDGIEGDSIPGDHVFTATIPGQGNRTLVRYRIAATDKQSPSSSIRAPFADDPSLNFAYYVYDGVPPYTPTIRTVHPNGLGHSYSPETLTTLPVYTLITRAGDMQTCIAYEPAFQIPRTNRGARSSFNWEGAFVHDGVVYDHMHYRLRGHNQRYQLQQKRNMRFKFNRGRYFQARDQKGAPYPTQWRTMLFAKMFGPRNVGNFGVTESINNILFNLVGVPAPLTHWIHFRVPDGVEEAPMTPNGQYEGDFWGMFLAMEDYDSRFLDSHGMPKGNLYKLTDGVTDGKEQQRYQARGAVSNAEDYNNIVANLHPAASLEWLKANVDYEFWRRYETVQQAIRHYDLGVYPEQENAFPPVDTPALKNIGWFFHPAPGNPLGKLQPLPWDHEQSWGENGAHQGWDEPLYAMIDPQITDGRAKVNYTGGPRQKEELYIEYRNFIREFRDLIWNEEALPPMIDRLATVITDFVPADRDRWKDHPLTGAAISDFGTLENKVADMKVYAFVGGTHWPVLDRPLTSMVAPGGRAVELDERSNYGGDAAAIPDKTTVTYVGPPGFPPTSLIFETSPFSDPQGPGDFAALKWRLGEITNPNAPFLDSKGDPILEWNEVWTSGELSSFSSQIQIPPGAVQGGHTYRARSRLKDVTGRWGHWSDPVEFTVAPQQSHSAGDVIISEVQGNVTGNDDDKEWIELFNTTNQDIDLRGWALADNETDIHAISGADPVTIPAKGYLVLGESTNPAINGGAPVDYSFANDITMGNNGDELILLDGATVIHSIGYGNFVPSPHPIQSAFPSAPIQGQSYGMGLDYCNGPNSQWTPQTSPYGTNGDLGTPGADNDGVTVCSMDTEPPQLVEAAFGRRDLVVLKFDEPLDVTSVLSVSNYTLDHGAGNPLSASPENPDTVVLQFGSPLQADTLYTISVENIADTGWNAITSPQTAQLQYSIPPVLISEIMYNNRGADVEWIELLNTTASFIDVSGWYLTDDDVYPAAGEGNVTLPPGAVLQPGEHVIVNLWGNSGFALWQMPPGIRVIEAVPGSVGALSNEGDNLALFNAASGGGLVDGSLSTSYPPLSIDGASLEKIDEAFPWVDGIAVAYNFRSSTTPIGFETGLNEDGEFLSSFASPGRGNGTAPPPTPSPTTTTSSTPTGTGTNTPTSTVTATFTGIHTSTSTPTSTETPTVTAALPSPTGTPSPSETLTVTATRDYDVAPAPDGDGRIDPKDLLVFLTEISGATEEAALLFDFSRFWTKGGR
ncbi:MAG: hypothetical protein GHCLOJNM_03444 [bacterium]|nr:hypothetical protein [bacterium]